MTAPLRHMLLKASESRTLERQITHLPFARRAVRRFMPGEDLSAALEAARAQAQQGIGAVLTHLGENVTDLAQAAAAARHYLDAIDQAAKESVGCEFSVKLTQLGLDIDRAACEAHVDEIAARAAQAGSFLWIDMEGSKYTDVTIDCYRGLRRRHPKLGLCLQAYLHRTAQDLETLIPLGAAIRLVKGAYDEPHSIAYATKKEVDENFYRLARRMLEPSSRVAQVRLVCGTHDMSLIARIQKVAAGLPFECHMLYGIRRQDQLRLVANGTPVSVLISYGSAWFPWYMRRLAERPANLWFVVKSLVT